MQFSVLLQICLISIAATNAAPVAAPSATAAATPSGSISSSGSESGPFQIIESLISEHLKVGSSSEKEKLFLKMKDLIEKHLDLLKGNKSGSSAGSSTGASYSAPSGAAVKRAAYASEAPSPSGSGSSYGSTGGPFKVFESLISEYLKGSSSSDKEGLFQKVKDLIEKYLDLLKGDNSGASGTSSGTAGVPSDVPSATGAPSDTTASALI